MIYGKEVILDIITKICKQRPKGYWSGKWYTFTRATQRCREFGALAPAEARWYPLMLAVHSAQVQWNKMWNRN